MTTSWLIDISRARTGAVDQALESWKSAHAEAMRVRDLEDLIRECAQYPRAVKQINNSLFERMKAGELVEPEDVNRCGDEFRDLCDHQIRVLTALTAQVARAERDGHEVEAAE